ncbi:alpha-IPM isomerase [Ramlibacter sp.]|uniref:LeuD/DmdB family oxidoreductase small subunit n=1 Tax=Ramlibacter sp. TaxID=1917967 RepID=UPI002CAC27D5|nr:alpha-IPM isomerase [Ramlibacter sp.]HWI82943.1 alpha-IPM isomerase [Ramlibacter sp.]
MNAPLLAGRARVLGDDVNTDYLISSSRKKESLDPGVLRQYLLEDLDPAFAASVQPGDILVAGRNFGCGSAMEVAVTVVLGAGIRAVIAASFSRTYWRNAINNGLLAIVADTAGIAEGEPLELHLTGAQPELRVLSQPPRRIPCEPLPPFMLAMREAGGLVPYLRRHRTLSHHPRSAP